MDLEEDDSFLSNKESELIEKTMSGGHLYGADSHALARGLL